MKISENKLRRIIKQTILEEQNRIDESAKDAITKGLLALMMTYSVNAVKNVANSMGESQESSITQSDNERLSFKGKRGLDLLSSAEDLIRKNKLKNLSDEDLLQLNFAIGKYTHAQKGQGGAQLTSLNNKISRVNKKLEAELKRRPSKQKHKSLYHDDQIN